MKIQDESEKQLFFMSTVITIGNGKNTPFWETRWLNGAAPKDLAPNLYTVAKYKYRTVHKEIHNFNWIRNLQSINSQTRMDEYILLYSALATVALTEEEDQITWRWTPDGMYSAWPAYDIQFAGTYSRFQSEHIWKTNTEPKCRFFAWLVIHDRVLTADNLAKKNWPHNEHCTMCYCQFETTAHLLIRCNYTEAVWSTIAAQLNLPNFTHMSSLEGPIDWVSKLEQAESKQARKMNLGNLFFFWWNIWKERNRRIFEEIEKSVPQLANQILDDINQYKFAKRNLTPENLL